jgi:hypothetical protein
LLLSVLQFCLLVRQRAHHPEKFYHGFSRRWYHALGRQAKLFRFYRGYLDLASLRPRHSTILRGMSVIAVEAPSRATAKPAPRITKSPTKPTKTGA